MNINKLDNSQEFARKRNPIPDRYRKIATPLYGGCCLADHRKVTFQIPAVSGNRQIVQTLGVAVLRSFMRSDALDRLAHRSGSRVGNADLRAREGRSSLQDSLAQSEEVERRSHKLTCNFLSGRPTSLNFAESAA
jgi:hypothetical protein